MLKVSWDSTWLGGCNAVMWNSVERGLIRSGENVPAGSASLALCGSSSGSRLGLLQLDRSKANWGSEGGVEEWPWLAGLCREATSFCTA